MAGRFGRSQPRWRPNWRSFLLPVVVIYLLLRAAWFFPIGIAQQWWWERKGLR